MQMVAACSLFCAWHGSQVWRESLAWHVFFKALTLSKSILLVTFLISVIKGTWGRRNLFCTVVDPGVRGMATLTWGHWLYHSFIQKAEKSECWCSAYCLHFKSKISACGIVLPKFRVGLPASFNSTYKFFHRYIQRCISFEILDSVKLILVIVSLSFVNFIPKHSFKAITFHHDHPIMKNAVQL